MWLSLCYTVLHMNETSQIRMLTFYFKHNYYFYGIRLDVGST